MHDDLLVVLSNHNGFRESLDLKRPRYDVTLDSFRSCVPYHRSLNVLLLDNNSTDGSEAIIRDHMQQVDSPTWRAQLKSSEDYYLGTLHRLVEEYGSNHEYLMLVDNDHFFFQKRDFLSTAMDFLKSHRDCVALQLLATTEEDVLDHCYHHLSLPERILRRTPRAVLGVFDELWPVPGSADVMLRAIHLSRARGLEQVKALDERRGGVHFAYPNYAPKRLCWMAFCAHNVILRSDALREILRDPDLQPPFRSNPERLALFASRVAGRGETWYYGPGASINFGFRKHAARSGRVGVLDLLDRYSSGNGRNLFTANGYSFFVEHDSVDPDIERRIRTATRYAFSGRESREGVPA